MLNPERVFDVENMRPLLGRATRLRGGEASEPVSAEGTDLPLIFIQILTRNIILRDLVCVDFPFIGVIGLFHTGHGICFESVPFL
jgi:hypothetical protein